MTSDAGGTDSALRDRLAVQRTELANQRTLLAFLTAALAVLVGGLTVIKFISGHWAARAGWFLIAAAAALAVTGAVNFFSHRKAIRDAVAGSGGRRV